MSEPIQRTAVILGCGSSGGVPRIDGYWGACDPKDIKNRRLRCSLLLEINEKRLIIDTSPDFREQCLRENVTRIDAVLFTHDHADQTHGIDDVRTFRFLNNHLAPTYADAVTADILITRFRYIFFQKPNSDYPPILSMRNFNDGEAFVPEGFTEEEALVIPFACHHGNIISYGFRIGNLAYCPDVHAIPEASFKILDGVETWITDCLRYIPHPTHANLETALQWRTRIRPKKMILTNLHFDFDYQTLNQETPDDVTPAYDGMRIAF